VLIEGYIRMVDAGFEGDFGGFEGVFVREDEEEFEFTALRRECELITSRRIGPFMEVFGRYIQRMVSLLDRP
jgi:hypothetical protein